MAGLPLIPDSWNRLLIDYVNQCSWCDYDARDKPRHREKCPRYRPPVVGAD